MQAFMSLPLFFHMGNQKCIHCSLDWIIDSQQQGSVFPLCQNQCYSNWLRSLRCHPFVHEDEELFCCGEAQAWKPVWFFAAQMCREGLLSYSLTGPRCVSPSNSAASHCRTVLMLFAGPVFVLCVPFQAVSLPVQLLFLRTFLWISRQIWRRA